MKKTLFILISFLALSCGSEDNNSVTDKTAQKLVTGITFRQNFDDAPLQLGNPNVLVNGKFVIYPNPAIETVIVLAQEDVSDVWIVPANAEKIHQDIDFDAVLNTGLYSQQSIVSNADFSLNGQTSNQLILNIGDLEQGYYRIFVKIGGEIYWDNLYKSDGTSEEQITEIMNFWN